LRNFWIGGGHELFQTPAEAAGDGVSHGTRLAGAFSAHGGTAVEGVDESKRSKSKRIRDGRGKGD
jgi:hypothetical protein